MAADKFVWLRCMSVTPGVAFVDMVMIMLVVRMRVAMVMMMIVSVMIVTMMVMIVMSVALRPQQI